jgi:signal transduction histidine kinase
MPPSTTPSPAPCASERSLLQVAWQLLRVGVPLCVAVAVFLSLGFGGSFVKNLVFSLCIGLTIQLMVHLGRHGLSRWLIGRGARHDGLSEGWPCWGWMAPWVVFSAVAGYVIGALVAGWITGVAEPLGVFGNPRALVVILALTLAVSIGATQYFYSQGRLAGAQAQAEAAQRLAAEHELKLLQSQLEPHMLFNTLANLRVLIGLDPARAQAMLDRLIAFLRATLAASRLDAHPLSAEFARLADYLALMQVRMGARLQVSLDLPPALSDLPVPPLLLQPLVENAIQHGLEPARHGGRLVVSARRTAIGLRLQVDDSGCGLPEPPTDTQAGHGFGLVQIRERLAVLYGQAAQLVLTRRPDGPGTLATIDLPLTARPENLP